MCRVLTCLAHFRVAVPVPAAAAVNASMVKEHPVSFSSPASQSRMTGVSPAKLAAQPAGKSGVGVKRSLPAAAVPAAAPAAPVKQESELGLKPLVSCPANEDGADVSDAEGNCEGEGEGSGDPLEQKRLKRMRRNRESAAMSRNRKKAYIEELEAKVAALKASVHQLQSENWTLKQESSSVFPAGAGDAGAAAPGGRHVAGSSSDAAAEDDLGLSLEPLGAMADDLCLAGLSPLDIPSSHGDEDASALPGGKKVSTAALAMMSALTFVTLSANSSGPLWSRDTGHSPGARVLMSLSDEPVRRFGLDGERPLWPAIDAASLSQPPQTQPLYESPEPIANALATALPTLEGAPVVTALPPPVRPPASASRSHARVEQVEQDAGKDAGRVLMLPRNSSWADALRVEAAEKQLMVRGEAMVRGSGAPVPDKGALLASPLPQYPLEINAATADKVYEPAWKDSPEEEEEYFDHFDLSDSNSIEAEAARRFIFCARAYTFDVTSGRRGARQSSPAAGSASPPVAAPAPSRELSLPAMPARFRHGAARIHELPQLTDGHPGGNESEPLPLPSARYPVVSMLLPSAALRGVVSGVDDDLSSDDISGELMQVSCQVLNASRWGGA